MPLVAAGYNVVPTGLVQVAFYVNSVLVSQSTLPSSVIMLGAFPAFTNITVTMEADYGAQIYRTTKDYTVADVNTTMTLPTLPDAAFSSRAYQCLSGRLTTTLLVSGGPFEVATPEGVTFIPASTVFSDYVDTTIEVPAHSYSRTVRIERLTRGLYDKGTFATAAVTLNIITPANTFLVVKVTNNYVSYPPATTETTVLCL